MLAVPNSFERRMLRILDAGCWILVVPSSYERRMLRMLDAGNTGVAVMTDVNQDTHLETTAQTSDRMTSIQHPVSPS